MAYKYQASLSVYNIDGVFDHPRSFLAFITGERQSSSAGARVAASSDRQHKMIPESRQPPSFASYLDF